MLSRYSTATLLCLALVSQAHAQSCAEQLRQAAPHAGTHTISATSLTIPASARRHFEEARQATANNQPQVAERESEKALALAPRYADVYLLRAVRELHDHDADAALRTIAAARAIEPTLHWASIVVASSLNQLHRYDEVIAELDRAPGDEADSWQGRFERARAEIGRGNTAAALQWSSLAVAAAPQGCTDARLVRANAFELAGRPDEAVTEFETYLAQDQRKLHRDQVVAALERTRAFQARRENSPTDSGELIAQK